MYIKRNILHEIMAHLPQKEITIVTGARQVGKTTMLKEVESNLLKSNEKTLFLNLDIESHAGYFRSQELFLNKIQLELGNDGYIFIDEIQRLENAGLFLKGTYDSDLNYKLLISGSGSLELKEKISESLLGRKRLFEMMPVDFLEFMNYKTAYKYEKKEALYFQVEQAKTLVLLEEYLNYGGYPRIITESSASEKLKLIHEIFQAYIEKDLVYLLKIERPEVFQTLIKILAAQTGNLINYSSLASQTSLSVPTVKKYLWYAEKTFCIDYVSPFYKNKLKEITKSPVYYFNDIGLRNYSINLMGNLQVNQHYGFVFQNFIYLLLKNYARWKNWTIHYWRTTEKAEVDFVIDKGTELLPIEVKYGMMNKPTISRSFRSFIEKYQPKTAWLINRAYTNELTINGTKVFFVPFYKLLAE